MTFLAELFTNKLFLAPAAGWFFAQVIKIIIDMIKNKTFNPDRITGSGGMPSSHSATVTGLFVISAITRGPQSDTFIISLFLAIIVIYDAAGVRLETQRQGQFLNDLREERQEEGKVDFAVKQFREKLGHTIPEILVGMLIGLICGLIVAYALPF